MNRHKIDLTDPHPGDVVTIHTPAGIVRVEAGLTDHTGSPLVLVQTAPARRFPWAMDVENIRTRVNLRFVKREGA